MEGMEEDSDVEQCGRDRGDAGDDDVDWSEPVGVCDTVLDNRHVGASHDIEVHRHTGSASLAAKDDHPRTIVHIDVDCFYAQVEMIHNPALRDVPLGIQQKYLVVTCNYPARAWGVTKLMGISEAKKKCPKLVLVSGEDLTRYREMSYKISEFLMKYTPYVERLGFDENFLDVTEMVDQRFRGSTARTEVDGHVYSPQDSSDQSLSVKPCPCGCHRRLAVGSQIAADIRHALNVELGITCCAGIAHNKLLAKLVGGQHKPNQQTTIFPCHDLSLVSALTSTRHIPGIGSATSKRLKALGIEAVIDLQRSSRKQLEEEFGVAMATTIHKLAFGIDDNPVVTYSKPQMLSVEDSFRRCSSEQDAVSRVSQLITSLLPRVQEDGRTPRTLRLTVRKGNKESRSWHRESRQCNLPSAIAAKIISGQLEVAQKNLISTAMSLFYKMVDRKQPFHLTLINVAFAKLEDTAVNDITTFFTSPSTGQFTAAVPSESQDHQDSSKADLCVNSKPPHEQVKSSVHRTRDNTVTDNPSPKRKGSGDLISFFTKKPKKDIIEHDPIELITHEKVRKHEDLPKLHTSQSSVSARNTVLPPDVDPGVFSQLPVEIQQEILQTVPQDSPAENQQMVRSSVLCRNSVDSKQVAVPSSSDLMHRHPSLGLNKERPHDVSASIQTKKAIFSPTKLKTMDFSPAQSITYQEGQLRPKKHEQVHDFTHADLEVKSTDLSEQKGSCPSEQRDLDPCSSSTVHLPPQNTQNCETSHPGLETFDRKFPDTQQTSAEVCDTHKPQTCNEKTSLLDSLHSPKMSVPKGVAPDVFSALPPEIQREIVAEAAMQAHSIHTSPPHSATSAKKNQTRSPAKKSNSILNYLKKT